MFKTWCGDQLTNPIAHECTILYLWAVFVSSMVALMKLFFADHYDVDDSKVLNLVVACYMPR